MKKIFFSIAAIVAIAATVTKSSAQSDERRNKVELTVVQGGKTIKTELNSVSTSITRYVDNEEPNEVSAAPVKDTSKAKVPATNLTLRGPGGSGEFYITIEAKSISAEMMKVFAKTTKRFDGTITVTDQYNQRPAKTIKFKQAAINSYSDQYSTVSYADNYGSAVLSLTCKELSIDGISIER